MIWTNEQLAAINFPTDAAGASLSADTRSATVTAAAGSGKTALLVQRVIRILCDTENPIPADRIAIMTFTRNAAEEFRRRMTDAVAAAARKDPTNSYISEQLIRFRSAPISTISSFCLGIIREHAESFSLPLSFTIIDDAKASLLKANALDTALEYFYSDDFDAEARDLLFKTFSFRDDAALSEAIGELHGKLSSLTDPEQWLLGTVEAYSSPEAAEERFMPFYMQTVRRLMECCKNSFDSFSAIIRALPDDHADRPKLVKMLADDEGRLRDAEAKLNALGEQPTLSDLYGFASTIGLNDKGVLRFATLSCKDEYIKERIKAPREKFKDYLKSVIACVPDYATMCDELPQQYSAIRSLASLVTVYGREYTANKRDGGYVDFADCEQLLLEKLRSDSEFRRQLSERFRCIIVDEFQDTNDIQYEIFRLISADEHNLFFVGDIKQSIYAFRGGNPRIMLSLCDPAYGSGHTPLPLNKNFRSRQQVIDTVNAVFTGLMTEKYGDVDYNDSTKLVCGAAYPDTPDDCTTELHLLDYNDERDKALAEAKYVTSLIRDMLADGFRVKQDDKSTRPCTYGDFCILLRASTSAQIYRQELESCGIPVSTGSSKSYLASDEITLILNFLRVIDNPLRDEELLQVLMSPVYMMSAQELAEARLGILGIDSTTADLTPLYERYKGASLFACISACARAADSTAFGAFSDELSDEELKKLYALRTKGHPKCVKFLQDLTSFRSFMANNSIERLIRRIYDDTDFYAVISTYEQGEKRLANIRLLLKYAADFENSGGGTLGDFLRYTDNVRDRNESFDEATTAQSADNAVKVMTFHASKGLEMPIVILAELGKNQNKSDMSGTMVFNRSAGIGLRYVDVNKRFRYKPFGYTAIAMAEEQKQKGEELRLLYVAMTRAREKLIMTGRCKADDIDSLRTDNFTPDLALSGNDLLDWILASLLRYSDGRVITDAPTVFGDGIVNVRFTAEVPEPAPLAEVKSERICLPDIAMAQRIRENISLRYRNEEQTTARSKFTVTEIAHMIDAQSGTDSTTGGLVFMSKPSFLPKGVLSGKEVGDAYHHVMEHFPINEVLLGRAADDDFCAEVLERLRSRNILSDAEHDAVKPHHIAAFFRSELGRRMLASKRIEREYPIFAEVPARDIYVEQDGCTMIQGRADMFFVEEDGIVLVDYKSDTKQNLEKELDAYSRQLAIYRTILPIMTGIKVKEIYIYSFSCDMAVSV